jgi:putative ABC transport system permease protein
MIRNYFKSTLRHLLKSKLYSFINVAGLAAGVTCTLLAVLYWKDEHSFDKFHKSNPDLYRITTSLRADKEGNRATVGTTGQVQGPAFAAAVPEIKNYVRVLGGDFGLNLIYENKILPLRALFVDTSFFNVFTFNFLTGNPSTALKDINSVVITESTARKFFNSINSVGKIFTMESDPSYEKLKKPLIVSAVVKDPPGNSSLQFDVLFTFEFMHLSFEDKNWLNTYLGTFVVLHPAASLHAVTEKFNKIYEIHAKEQINSLEFNNYGFDPEIKYGLQPMADVHFNTYLTTGGFNEGRVINSSNPVYSYAFMGIALFILLMAAINFINISVAGSLKRAKEVGVRKISGGNAMQIILQFLIESTILCFASFLLSLVLMDILLPVFNSVTGKQLYLSAIIDWKLITYFVAVLLFVILLTGFYPAFVLSRFKATEGLYNKQKLGGRNLFGRGLVILQFSLAVFLMMATIVYISQMSYIRGKDLGYNPSSIIRTEVYGDRDYKSIISYLKNELAREPSLKTVSFGNNGGFEDIDVNNRSFKAMRKGVDANYLSLMQIPVLAGRNLSDDHGEDTRRSVIVNQSFVKAANLQQPIGQTILINRHYDSSYKRIVGVIRDFHFHSLREPIRPMVMYIPETAEGSAVIWAKFEKVNQQKAIAAVERIYRSAMPKALYRFNFIDELNAREYILEQRWLRVINFASTVAIILCSLGLFGLAHLAAQRRIKEVGIRKTLGATVSNITSLLTKDFLKLVIVALAIALPIAWWIMNNWLQDFAYRIGIT